MVMARIKSNYNDNAAVKKKVYMFRKFAAAVASVIIIVIASIIFSDVFNKGLLKVLPTTWMLRTMVIIIKLVKKQM